MIGFLSKRLWPWVIAAASGLAAMLLIRRDGRLSEKRRQAERAAKVQRGMRRAGEDVSTDRDSIVRRLRNGRF